MSKVICDICGTAYPETSTQCPICGCAKDNSVQTPAADAAQKTEGEAAVGYTYVKGGRFSKRNVRRRNQKGKSAERRTAPAGTRTAGSARPAANKRPTRAQQKEESTNRGLVAVVIVLLLAIIAVVIYIFLRVFGQSAEDPNKGQPNSTVQTNPSGTQDTGSVTDVPCTALQLSNHTIEFTADGQLTKQLIVNPVPADTTDTVEFFSSDESVATVSEDGTITAVGSGVATITVKCGDVTAECTVYSSVGSEAPIDPPELIFEFNTRYVDVVTGYSDTTLNLGETWKAYKSSLNVDPSEITWVSDDPSVCTIENGIVNAVGAGKTYIYASYNGETYTCIIRVK